MKNKKLKIERDRIDNIDKKIFVLIKQRTKVVQKVLNLKRLKSQIVDRKRINDILKNIKKKSIKEKVDHILTQKIWKSMIWSYIDLERRKFKKK
jgi:chorismate mutase|tara:strand:- start:148 stop:429 length:282 start_codon:yes stop_codon:yes gene_type:complete